MDGGGNKLRARMRGTVLNATQPTVGQLPRRVVKIGIAGPSGVGKSLLAEKLATALDSPCIPICLDWFLTSQKGATTFERPETLNFSMLRTHLQTLCSTIAKASRMPQHVECGPDNKNVVQSGCAGRNIKAEVVPVIIEGFLLFHDVQLCNMLDVHLWIKADRETCMLRRRSRNKKRSKESKAGFDSWYCEDVWPHFELYKGTQLANASDALILDGTASVEEILKKSLDHCQEVFQEARPASLPAKPAPPSEPPPAGLLTRKDDLEEAVQVSRTPAPPSAPPPSWLLNQKEDSEESVQVSRTPAPPSAPPPSWLLNQKEDSEDTSRLSAKPSTARHLSQRASSDDKPAPSKTHGAREERKTTARNLPQRASPDDKPAPSMAHSVREEGKATAQKLPQRSSPADKPAPSMAHSVREEGKATARKLPQRSSPADKPAPIKAHGAREEGKATARSLPQCATHAEKPAPSNANSAGEEVKAAASQTSARHDPMPAPGTFLRLLSESSMDVWRRLCHGVTSDCDMNTEEDLTQPQKRLRTDPMLSV